MRKYLLAAAAAAAIATPAMARDRSFYVGIDGGALFDARTTTTVDASQSYYCEYYVSYALDNCAASFRTKHRTGWDVDAVYGYDFGRFRLEAEAGLKRALHDEYVGDGGSADSAGRTKVWSVMLNGLVDLGSSNGVNFSLGGGVGYAHTRFHFHPIDTDGYLDPLITSLSRGEFAWQLLAEARAPITRELDIGVKYRYFNAGKIRQTFDDGVDGTFTLGTRFRSHSVLASLVYNFVGEAPPAPAPVVAPPPPPPPPPPPATQTCPDGSVIDAAATCPAPPPPPPPPPEPTPERG